MRPFCIKHACECCLWAGICFANHLCATHVAVHDDLALDTLDAFRPSQEKAGAHFTYGYERAVTYKQATPAVLNMVPAGNRHTGVCSVLTGMLVTPVFDGLKRMQACDKGVFLRCCCIHVAATTALTGARRLRTAMVQGRAHCCCPPLAPVVSCQHTDNTQCHLLGVNATLRLETPMVQPTDTCAPLSQNTDICTA